MNKRQFALKHSGYRTILLFLASCMLLSLPWLALSAPAPAATESSAVASPIDFNLPDFSLAEQAAGERCDRQDTFARQTIFGCLAGLAQTRQQMSNSLAKFDTLTECEAAEAAWLKNLDQYRSEQALWCSEHSAGDIMDLRGCLDAGEVYFATLATQGFCPAQGATGSETQPTEAREGNTETPGPADQNQTTAAALPPGQYTAAPDNTQTEPVSATEAITATDLNNDRSNEPSPATPSNMQTEPLPAAKPVTPAKPVSMPEAQPDEVLPDATTEQRPNNTGNAYFGQLFDQPKPGRMAGETAPKGNNATVRVINAPTVPAQAAPAAPTQASVNAPTQQATPMLTQTIPGESVQPTLPAQTKTATVLPAQSASAPTAIPQPEQAAIIPAQPATLAAQPQAQTADMPEPPLIPTDIQQPDAVKAAADLGEEISADVEQFEQQKQSAQGGFATPDFNIALPSKQNDVISDAESVAPIRQVNTIRLSQPDAQASAAKDVQPPLPPVPPIGRVFSPVFTSPPPELAGVGVEDPEEAARREASFDLRSEMGVDEGQGTAQERFSEAIPGFIPESAAGGQPTEPAAFTVNRGPAAQMGN